MATLQKRIDEIDPSTREDEIIKEQLETLMKCAEANALLGEQAIVKELEESSTATPSNLGLPISRIIARTKQIRVVTTESSTIIVEKVREGINQLISLDDDAILGGIAGLVSTSIIGLMGQGMGVEAKQEVHIPVLDGIGIVRLDFAIWVRNTKAVGIREKCKHAISVVAIKSAVDIRKIDLNTFLVLYKDVLDKSYGNNNRRINALLNSSKKMFITMAFHTPLAMNMSPIYGVSKLPSKIAYGLATLLKPLISHDKPAMFGPISAQIATDGDF